VDKIQKKAVLKPFLGGNKVFVFWGAESMMPQTSNKLLKILEEPPINTYFILITNSLQDILPTIISRCQISTMRPISYDDHKAFLERSFDGVEHGLIANSSRGSIARSMNYINEDVASISHEQNFIECPKVCFFSKKKQESYLRFNKMGRENFHKFKGTAKGVFRILFFSCKRGYVG
jgi:DNA polymerase-3 subunit delta'